MWVKALASSNLASSAITNVGNVYNYIIYISFRGEERIVMERTCHFCKINKSVDFIYNVKLDYDGKFFPYLPICNNCKIEYINIWRSFIQPIIRNVVIELSKSHNKKEDTL